MTIRVCVLASGGGTDLQSIIDASEAGEIDAKIALVISNNKDAYCLERAKKHGIEPMHIDHRGISRREHEEKLALAIDERGIDLIVHAGYLRMQTEWFVEKYYGRMINIHPALLPLFGGAGMHGENVHRSVLESGMKVSGCTVHFVSADVDMGPIIAQKCVPVEEGDTVDTLAARVLAEEHKLLPKAVGLFADGRLQIDGRVVKVLPGN